MLMLTPRMLTSGDAAARRRAPASLSGKRLDEAHVRNRLFLGNLLAVTVDIGVDDEVPPGCANAGEHVCGNDGRPDQVCRQADHGAEQNT